MTEWQIKEAIVEIGKRSWQRGYVASNDGNISVRLNDNEILTTPTGVSKGFMTSEMIVKVDINGNLINKQSKFKPSSELKMHLDIYQNRDDVKSVVHMHPPFATSFAVAGIPLNKCILPEAVLIIGAVPIAKYGLPSTDEIPDNIRPHLKNSDAILLQNHGAITLGGDLMSAYYKMETLEHSAHVVWNAIQLGNINVLPEGERDRLYSLRDVYGLKGKAAVCDASPNVSNNNCACQTNTSQDELEIVVKNVISKLKSNK